MSVSRFCRHFFASGARTRKVFTPVMFDAIEREIADSETRHGGEIRFVVETALSGSALLRGSPPRARAMDVFAQMGVWDTELNNGVLIYILLADRDVEIVADRGFNGRVCAAQWEAVCRDMEGEFRESRFAAGALAGIRGVSALIAQHFPPLTSLPNELPDRPTFL